MEAVELLFLVAPTSKPLLLLESQSGFIEPEIASVGLHGIDHILRIRAHAAPSMSIISIRSP